ncbi:hypothetical protein [Xanthomonas sp. WHRI 7945]|nr:hypothetical protein [Xanthomonas campestris pv. campestris]
MSNERDFLDEITQPTAAPESATTDAPAAATGEPAAATTGEPAAQAQTAEAPPAAATDKDERVPLAALKAEREKRQNEQRQREKLERRLREVESAREQPEFFENPEAYVQQSIKGAQHEIQQRFYAAMDADAREQFPDYDEVLEALKEHAQGNPAIVQQVFSAPNPARAAYKLGKQLREMAQMQDPEAYRQKIEAEVRAKVEAEFTQKQADRAATIDRIPPDLSTARSAAATTRPGTGGVFDNLF